MSGIWDDWASFLVKGGLMMGPLMLMASSLWYAIGYRLLTLKRGSNLKVSQLYTSELPPVKDGNFRGFLVEALDLGRKEAHKQEKRLRHRLEDVLFPLQEKMGNFRNIVAVLTALAPLAGLLGTVTGMIEMFDSLATQTFVSQTGGIAGGISQALYTTELGLIIAVPGVIVGRLLDRKEDEMREDLEQLKDLLVSRTLEDGV